MNDEVQIDIQKLLYCNFNRCRLRHCLDMYMYMPSIADDNEIVDYATSFLSQFFTTSGEKLVQVHEFAYVLFAIFSFQAIPKIIGYFMWMWWNFK